MVLLLLAQYFGQANRKALHKEFIFVPFRIGPDKKVFLISIYIWSNE